MGPILSGVTAKRKHPGSVLGDGWQYKTSRDPEVITEGLTGTDWGIYIHLGRSGLVAFDVDVPDLMPPVLRAAIEAEQPPYQPTRTSVPGRGHYLFRVPEGRKLGNSLGKLKSPDGKWGEVRSGNGVIVVCPSPHENAPDGHYGPWIRAGVIPVLPESVASLLPDKQRRGPTVLDDGDSGFDAATDSEVKAFFAEHTRSSRPGALRAVQAAFAKEMEQQSRHMAAVSSACWAMREAAAGIYRADRAAEDLRNAFIEAMKRPTDGSDRVLSRREASSEFDGIVAWAVGQVPGENLDQVRRSAMARIDKRRLLRMPDHSVEEDDRERETETEEEDEQERPSHDDDDGGAAESDEPESEQDDEEGVEDPTWVERDLGVVVQGLLDGTRLRPVPTIGFRSDGEALFYARAVNGLHGPSGDGKTFGALLVCFQEIRARRHVVFIDLEADEDSICARLLDFGLALDEIITYFHYFNPQEPYGEVLCNSLSVHSTSRGKRLRRSRLRTGDGVFLSASSPTPLWATFRDWLKAGSTAAASPPFMPRSVRPRFPRRYSRSAPSVVGSMVTT